METETADHQSIENIARFCPITVLTDNYFVLENACPPHKPQAIFLGKTDLLAML